VYRVIDDQADRIVYLETMDQLVEVEGQTFPNRFGFVPCMTNSSLPNPDGDGFISPLNDVMDLADQYLLKTSMRITHDFRHAYPKYWEYGDTCIKCKGTGKVSGSTCPECRGTGTKIMLSVADNKVLEYPNKETPALKGDPGGYIEPSKTFHDIITFNLAELEERMYQTLWGSKSGTKLKPGLGLSAAPNGIVTATEVMDNRQPEIEFLNTLSDAAERRDKFIVDSMVSIAVYRNAAYINNGGCSKNYGRRFLIEEPDALLKRYEEARRSGASAVILYGLYEQYLEAKYQSDGVSLNLHKKLMRIEPWMHYTMQEMSAARFSDEEIRKKVLWGEWLAKQRHNSLILASENSLEKSFLEYVTERSSVIEKKEEPQPNEA
jgi:hypothetical protein